MFSARPGTTPGLVYFVTAKDRPEGRRFSGVDALGARQITVVVG